MDKNISFRNAEVEDIKPIKDILYCSLNEYNIAIADNYSVSDINIKMGSPFYGRPQLL